MRFKGPCPLGVILLLVYLYQSADARKCNLNCVGTTGNLLKFHPGKTYQYKLEGHSVTTLPGAKDETSKVGIAANVEVSAASECEHVLVVSGVHTTASDGKKYNLDKTLGSNPLKFALQNGKVVDLCTSETESKAALNIKRAVLSLLQSSVLKESGYAFQHETDVFGNCPTNFEFVKHGKSVVVRKTKDLTKCAYREHLNLQFSLTSYFIPSDLQSTPLLLGSLNTEQKLEGGLLQHASSEEVYNYNPLSAAEAAYKVQVNTKLTFVGQIDKPAPPTNANSGKSLVFQEDHPEAQKGGVQTMVELLRSSCDTRIVTEDGASKFSRLVRVMGDSPKEELLQVYRQVKSGQGFKEKDVAKKMYMDAVVQANSASSVEVMAELLKRKEVTGSKAQYFYLLLGSVKHATRAALLAVKSLIEEDSSPELYLGAGALGGRFCREHNCAKFSEVEAFQTKLAAPLLTKGCKPNNKKEEDTLLASLKGLANMKYLTKTVASKLADYVADSELKARIRVALFDTIKSDPNKPEFKTVAGEVFKNPLEDSEVRIKAYLVLAACPCGKVAALVKTVLENEKSYQVGSFVTSHLRNLRASTYPEKAHAKHHLAALLNTQKYPVDFRKYSQNFENSYSLDFINLGAFAESNVIYSQESYVPRSVSFNLSTNIFGHALNWFEVNVRAENLEKELERVFGPRGKLRKHKYHEVYEEGSEYVTSLLEDAAERYEKSFRPKRSVSHDQLNALANKVNLHREADDDVDVDVSLKLYGNELFWVKYHGVENRPDLGEGMNKLFEGLDDSLNSAKELDLDYRKHVTFLDGEIVYPTGLGLPLKLKALGSTAFRLKLDGKFDFAALVKDPKNTDVRLQVLPSAAVEVRGDFVVDGLAFEEGVKVAINLHTSTGSDLTFRVLDGRGVDVKFGLPVKKQDVLSVSTDVATIIKKKNSPEHVVPVVFDVKREKYDGCFDQLSQVLGVTVCGKVDVPWEGHRSVLPSYGPSKFSLHVDKDDDSLTYYHFKVYTDEREGVGSFELLFDTPNSRENRKVALNVEGSLSDKTYLKLDLKSPWTNALFDAALILNKKELSFNVKFIHDDVEYYLRTGAVKSQQGNVVKFEPVLEYKAPEQTRSALVGRRGGPKHSAQVITLTGAVVVETLENEKKWKFESLSLNTPKTKYSIDGTGTTTPHGFDLDVVAHYDKEHVKIKGNFKRKDKNGYNQLTVLPSQYPDFNLNAKWDYYYDPVNGKYESKLNAIHGTDPNSATNKLFIHNKLDLNKKDNHYGTENTVTYPLVNLDGHVGFRVTEKSLKTELRGKFDKYSVQLLVQGDINTKKEGDYNVEIRWELMGNSVALTSYRKVMKNHQSKFNNVLEVKPGGKYELRVLATHKHNKNDLDYSADVDLVLPADPKNVKLKAGLKHNNVETKGHLNAVAGSKQYLQSDFSVKPGDKPSGAFKVKVPDYVFAQGDFLFDGTNFKSKSKIELPKVQRQLDGKANFVVSNSKYSGSAELCWEAGNPEKTLKFQTDTLVQDNSVDSKNLLVFAGKKTVLNLKGSQHGNEEKSNLLGELEFVLPNGDRVVFKSSDNYDFTNIHDASGEGEVELTLQKSGKEPLKITVKGITKNVDVERLNFDGQFTLYAVTPEKKELNSHLVLKKAPKGEDKWLVKGEFAVTGNLVDRPVTIKLDSEVPTELFDDSNDLTKLPPLNYHLSLNAGSDVHLESSGKVGGNILSGDLSAKLPQDSPVTSVKWVTSNFVDLFNDDNKYKVKASNELHWNNENFIKVSGEANCEPNGLNYVAEWETNELSKRKLSGAAHWFEDQNTNKADGNAVLSWEGKTADLSVKTERNNENVYTFHLVGNTPEHGKVDVQLKNKVVKNGKGVHSELVITNKDKKLAVLSKVELEPNHPLLDIVVDHPDGKTKFMWKVDNRGEKHWASEVKAKWTGKKSGTLALDSEVMLKSIDNFLIKHHLDAPLSGMANWYAELSNRPGSGEGKKITFTIKEEEKLLVFASSNYVVREDGQEKIIEGNGNLKLGDKQFPLNFKGTWISTESETAAKVLVKSEKSSVALVYKHNDNEFNLERTVCFDESKCSKFQVLNRARFSGLDEYDHTLVVTVDLHLIRPSFPDLSYVGSYKRKGQTVDHLVEAKVANEVKFKYLAYVHDKETGLFLTLPKRTVGAELKLDTETRNDHSGVSSKLEANLYLNKEKNDKLCLTVNSDIARAEDSLKLSGEAKLTHPSLKKDLYVKGHYSSHQLNEEADLVLDVFNNENEKVVLSLRSNTVKENAKLERQTVVAVKSPACKLDVHYDRRAVVEEGGYFSLEEKFSYVDSHGSTRESKAQYKLSPLSFYVLFTLPSLKLLEIDGKFVTKGKDLEYTGFYIVGSRKSEETLRYNSESNHAEYHYLYDGNTLHAEAGFLMGKSASLNLGFNDKPATKLEVALDETNFLKTQHNYDPEVIKNIWTSLGELVQHDVEEFKNLVTDAYKKEQPELNHFVNCLSRCLPDFTNLRNHLEGELKQLKEEALSDAELSNAVNHLRESFGTLFDHLKIFAQEFEKLLETVSSLTREYVDKMTEVFNKVAPKVTEALDSITKLVVTLLEQYVKVCLSFVDQLVEELKKYQEDLDAFTNVFTDLLHEVGKQFAKVLLVVHEEVRKFIEVNLEQLKELPVTNMLKEKLNELKELTLTDEAWAVYTEVVDNLKQFLPTTECEDFVSALSSYITKVLKQEPVNNIEAGKELYEKLVQAVKSLLTKFNEIAPYQGGFKPEKYLSLPLVSLVTLPAGGVRWSTLNFLRSNDFPAFVGSLETFAPSLNLLDNIPPFQAYAHIIQNTEVITFDGRHYTVRGQCSYVLAEDYVDRNFSVVGHFKEGKLEAITAFDHEHSVTLRNNAAPLKDGLEAEYPLKIGLLKAWKTPNSVGFRSKAGVVLFCKPTLDSCVLQVSGFYFHKLRGLFGTLNYEPYDDFILPPGSVGSEVSQFCNSWKVENTCPDVPAVPVTHQRQRECTEFFTSDDSDLVWGRPWLPLGPYRDACDHLVAAAPAADKKKVACEVAKSYVFVAQKKGALLLDVPSECVICDINNKKVGDEESVVVTPAKAADVVVLVDVLKKNEEIYKHLIQPLVPQLREELKKKGINDVHVTLVSFNSPTNSWTNYHSVNGKLEFSGHDCVLEFEEESKPRIGTWLDRLLNSKQQFFEELGSNQRSKAYEDLLSHHNFRPHALKTIVAVHGEPCFTGSNLNLFIPLRTFIQSFKTLNQGVVWNLFTPVNRLATDLKDEVTNKDIVGFTDEELYTLSKGAVKGDVDFGTDYCLPAVHATGGVVFPTYNFKDFNKSGKGAEFVQVSAELIAKSLLNAKQPLECSCSLTHGVLTRPDCEVED